MKDVNAEILLWPRVKSATSGNQTKIANNRGRYLIMKSVVIVILIIADEYCVKCLCGRRSYSISVLLLAADT
jgi:hypothetical protein